VLLAELDATLDAFQVGPQADDTALIALRRQPIASAADDTIRQRASPVVSRATEPPRTTHGRRGRLPSSDAVLLSACLPHRHRQPADTSD